MKSILAFSILSVFLSAMISCGGSQHDSSTSAPVVLDNGKRWVANPETTTGIKNMVSLLNEFTDNANIDAYASLEDKLLDEYRLIFKNCTMKGEAHEQLHNYLVPMSAMFEGLESADLTTCKESFNSLRAHLDTYVTYFE